MRRLRLGVTNIYFNVGLVLILVALACIAALFALWPISDWVRVILLNGGTVGMMGGLVLYVIGRIVQVARSGPRP